MLNMRFLLSVAVTLITTSALFGDAPLEGTKPAQWRLIWTADPATSATISWSTAKLGSKHVVHYQRKGNKASQQQCVAESGRYTGKIELYYHHARLTGLEPATPYEIQIASDDDLSPKKMFFVTAPKEDRTFSILHGGDSRSDRKARRRVNEMISKMFSTSHANDQQTDDILAFAHGGDYIASGTNLEQWSAWLSDHELTVAEDGRMLPIIPARGNHDRGPQFNEVFGFPEGDLNYYAINIGPQLRFVTLNTETSTAGDQAKWLNQELGAARAANRWVLAQYHRPAFPAVKSASSALPSWVPLFEKHYIDLVCEADGHNIKRTVPIRDGRLNESGIVYIGEGGLGVPQRTPKADRWYLQVPGMSSKGHHVFVLTFEKSTLTGKCVLESGKVRDKFIRQTRK